MKLRKLPRVFLVPLVILLGAQSLLAAGLSPERLAVLGRLLGSAKPVNQTASGEMALWHSTSDGFVSYVGAPPSHRFANPASTNALPDAESAAQAFLAHHADLFGVAGRRHGFRLERIRAQRERNYVRLQQTYGGVPVFAGLTTIQVSGPGEIECVLADLARDLSRFEKNPAALSPRINAAEAAAFARSVFAHQVSEIIIEQATPGLLIFAPAVLDEPGEPELVWELVVHDPSRAVVHQRVLVSAMDKRVVRSWTLNPEALSRQVFDKFGSPTGAAVLIRSEGQPPSGNVAADNAYDYLGDTYSYYFLQHGRDSWDGNGAAISATVNYCNTNNPCPWRNATAAMIFGAGWASDDVVAHEFTHNVTANESDLIYTNVSGAINESLSDIWGEFVDLWNNRGNDNVTNRWLVGEDINGPTQIGAIRSMTNPPAFGDPDRLGSTNYQQTTDTSDNGGVHRNSGVANKLCVLLTDGGNFNGQTNYGMAPPVVANLFYEAQCNLLTAAANWTDLYNSLRQAAININLSEPDRQNVTRGCFAVEIGSFQSSFTYVDWALSCPTPNGSPACVPGGGPFPTLIQGINAATNGDTVIIRAGNYNQNLTITKMLQLQAENGPVTIGQ